jgi:hypothetical protein
MSVPQACRVSLALKMRLSRALDHTCSNHARLGKPRSTHIEAFCSRALKSAPVRVTHVPALITPYLQGRFRVQSRGFEPMWLLGQELAKRLTTHFAALPGDEVRCTLMMRRHNLHIMFLTAVFVCVCDYCELWRPPCRLVHAFGLALESFSSQNTPNTRTRARANAHKHSQFPSNAAHLAHA